MKMQQQQVRRTSGSKAIAIDNRATIARYRLIQLLALILSAVFALGLHLIFGH
jgi:hypothetical protein